MEYLLEVKLQHQREIEFHQRRQFHEQQFQQPRKAGCFRFDRNKKHSSGNTEENILFDSPMNRAKYKKVLHACSMKKDLELFSHEDQTIICDRGINLRFKGYIMTIIATKTVIFVTHQVEFLPAVDMILVFKEGHIIQAEKYDDLLQARTDFQNFSLSSS